MSMQDPVADLLTRVRNGQMALLSKVQIPHSKLKLAIATLLQEEGYVSAVSVDNIDESHSNITIELKYYKDRPVIEKINRVSRPGLRRYFRSDDLPKIKGGLGVAVVSTSKGLMTDRKARQAKLGGELLFTVE
jgi:small subunit ribosomal protein S8